MAQGDKVVHGCSSCNYYKQEVNSLKEQIKGLMYELKNPGPEQKYQGIIKALDRVTAALKGGGSPNPTDEKRIQAEIDEAKNEVLKGTQELKDAASTNPLPKGVQDVKISVAKPQPSAAQSAAKPAATTESGAPQRLREG